MYFQVKNYFKKYYALQSQTHIKLAFCCYRETLKKIKQNKKNKIKNEMEIGLCMVVMYKIK